MAWSKEYSYLDYAQGGIHAKQEIIATSAGPASYNTTTKFPVDLETDEVVETEPTFSHVMIIGSRGTVGEYDAANDRATLYRNGSEVTNTTDLSAETLTFIGIV